MIDVFIINRNLCTWPKKMVEDIKSFDLLKRIIIVDNQSTYGPTLDWYDSEKDVIVHKLNENVRSSKCVGKKFN